MSCLFLAGCGSTPPSNDAGCPPGVLVAVSDFTSSGVGVLPLDGSPPQLLFGSELGADPALTSSAGRSFYIERDQTQNVYELDSCGRALASYSSRTGAEVHVDPQDVAVAPDGALWIARFSVPTALVSASSGMATVDMSSLDADGNPDMSSGRILATSGGAKAFFALERLDDNDPMLASKQPSQMAVVDVATHAIEQVVTLAGRNPFGLMVESQGALWLADMGNADADHEPDAGIEVFSPQTRTTALLISESAIGVSVGALAIDGACGAAIGWDATSVNHTVLLSFDTSGHVVQNPAFGPTTGFDLMGMVWAGGRLLVGDRQRTSSGFAVHTFTRDATCHLSQGADLFLPMPPVAFLANGL